MEGYAGLPWGPGRSARNRDLGPSVASAAQAIGASSSQDLVVHIPAAPDPVRPRQALLPSSLKGAGRPRKPPGAKAAAAAAAAATPPSPASRPASARASAVCAAVTRTAIAPSMSQRAAGRWRIYDRVVITTGRAEGSERERREEGGARPA